jgi:hypothetical protein
MHRLAHRSTPIPLLQYPQPFVWHSASFRWTVLRGIGSLRCSIGTPSHPFCSTLCGDGALFVASGQAILPFILPRISFVHPSVSFDHFSPGRDVTSLCRYVPLLLRKCSLLHLAIFRPFGTDDRAIGTFYKSSERTIPSEVRPYIPPILSTVASEHFCSRRGSKCP